MIYRNSIRHVTDRADTTLERLSIRWQHMIDKNSLKVSNF